MSIGVLLWIVLSAVILGVFGWSTYILYQQKKAWKAFATKYKLKYEPGRLLQSASINGYIDETRVEVFSAEAVTADIRGRRFLSAIEIVVPKKLVDSGATGTPDVLPFLETLDLLKLYPLKSEHWNEEHKFFVKHKDAMHDFFSEEMVRKFAKLLKIKNASVLIMFDGEEFVIRVETPDALAEEKKLEDLVFKLIKHVNDISLDPETRNRILEKVKSN